MTGGTVAVVAPGSGRITVQLEGSEAILSELSSSYPLKLLSPRLPPHNVAVVYTLSYGGGLVAGDRVGLAVDVQDSAALVLLTQGSTKVFKTRPGQRNARPLDEVNGFTSQRMDVTVHPGGSLFLLPDPVTCFRSACYTQLQTFRVDVSASVVLLDWINSGRKALGENWSFARYYSLNELWIGGKRVARDAMLLEESQSPLEAHQLNLPVRTVAQRLAPYSCYATVLIYGPLTTDTIQSLLASYSATTVFKHNARPPLVWSISTICEGQGCVLRVAALETEDVRCWLGANLTLLEGTVGHDIYSKAFG
ncbi:UreD-domain-containing protein [Irpex rosettiformis]|uniref:UreD-domain-containing protein n=1 Tax=Irpex rosettiformis TaxID=378272 RepID=A0ACB8UKV7_9APHY|nr:UreD-domain-containing protein [Irpex rosettiformis]